MISLKATEVAITTLSKEELEAAVVVNLVEATRTTITGTLMEVMEVILNKDSAETPITTKVGTDKVVATTTTITKVVAMVTPKAVGTAIKVISLEENLNRLSKLKAVTSKALMARRD